MKKFKFTIRGNNYNVEILSLEGQTAEVDVNGTHYHVDIHNEVKQSKTPKLIRSKVAPNLNPDKKRFSSSEVLTSIKAPLPGTILSVKVQVGQEVKMGDTLLIMEAMKMENEVKSDTAGKITAIKVKEGDSVLEGDLLIEFETEMVEETASQQNQNLGNAPSQSSSVQANASGGELKAPLPGTILKLVKREGDSVSEGDTILIMEAMKMENEVKSDFSGKLKLYKVKEGDSVLEGDTLAVIGG